MDHPRHLSEKSFKAIMDSVGDLHARGGLGLALAGIVAAILFIIVIAAGTYPDFAKRIGDAAPQLYLILILFSIAASLYGLLERYIGFRLAQRQIEMISTIAEELVRGAIPKNDRLSTQEISPMLEKIFSAISQCYIHQIDFTGRTERSSSDHHDEN